MARRPTGRPAGEEPAPGVDRRAADRDLEVMVQAVTGAWGPLRFSGPARIRLTSDAVWVDAPHGASLRAPLAEITGAAWRTGSLVLHGAEGRVTVEADAALESAFVLLLSRACPLPEFTRGFRRLGSVRGGPAAAQARVLAPLLQARRQLQDEADLDRRVEVLDARVIRGRMADALDALAADAWPESGPDRRGLRAELADAMEPLFRQLDALEEAAERFRAAGESTRFVAWRAWVESATAVFVHADRAWSGAVALIPARAWE